MIHIHAMAVSPWVVGIVFLCTGIGSLGFLVISARNWEIPGSRGFALATLGISLWTMTLGVSKFVIGYTVSLVAYNIVLLGTHLVSLGLLLLAVEFTGLRPLSRRLVGSVTFPFLALQALIWTNPLHHLVLGPGTTVENTIVVAQYRPGFWLHAVASYSVIAVGAGLLIRETLKSSGIRQKQAALLAVAIIPPLAANIVSVFNLALAPYDVTPFGYVIMDLILAWALFRLGFLEIVPIARQTAMGEMTDAMVTVDEQDTVVDCNRAAQSLFDASECVGTPASELFAGLTPNGYDTVRAVTDNEREVTISVDGETHHLLLSVSPIEHDRQTTAGVVVVLRDITPIKQRERALQAREQELDLFRQVITRVLRHNLRNELSKIKGNADVIAAHNDDETAERAHSITAASDTLMDTSEKARRIERLLEQDDDQKYDLRQVVEQAIVTVQQRFPDCSYNIEGLDTCHLEAVSGMEAAITNLIENAAEHNTADDPRVSVSLRATETGVCLQIMDNGPGLPDHELSVLNRAEETPLEHGSGVGLWLINWVISNADAEIEFETDESGTTVSILFEPETPVTAAEMTQTTEQPPTNPADE
jgi:PAS domain S-box-containing protein